MEGLDSILYALAEACNIILAGLAEGSGKILRGLMKGWLGVAVIFLFVWLGWISWAWESVRSRPSVTLGTLGISVAALGVWLWRRWRRLKRCVAVLPFESHYPPRVYEDFCNGLSTAFSHKLSEKPHLAKIRETAEVNQLDLAGVCRSLGVYSVLRGVLDWDNNTIRVTLKLIHRDGQTLLWSGQFTADLTPALTMQETLSTQMAEAFWHYRATA
jgi:TolB-like protein